LAPADMVRRARAEDYPAIFSIYNYYVENSVSAFDLRPRSSDSDPKWIEEHDENHPIIVVEEGGDIRGWASLSSWSPHEAYDHTVELSFFVDSRYRRRGYGKTLFSRILRTAEELGYHCVVSRVAEGNDASRKMHEKAGFLYVGVMKEVGGKFGRWLDVHVYQKVINAQRKP
jgi:L-amino acid N-acyltransferase YncA